MNVPVFDLHCDTACALLGSDRNSAGSLRNNQLHIDLERAKKLAGYAQCFACYTSPLMEGVSPVVMFERELATIQREIENNKRLISIAYSPEDIRANREKGKISAILTIEGPAGFDYAPDLLEDLSLIGFRMTTLTWNEKNPLAGSHLTGGGLTDQGREFVREAQRLGMLIDVSHLSDEAFWEIFDITQAPIVASHSNSRHICNVRRMICSVQSARPVVWQDSTSAMPSLESTPRWIRSVTISSTGLSWIRNASILPLALIWMAAMH